MNEIRCYICERKVEEDAIVRHIRGHSDGEWAKAQRKVIRERRKTQKGTTQEGPTEDTGDVVESSHDEPMRRLPGEEAPGELLSGAARMVPRPQREDSPDGQDEAGIDG